MTLVQAWIDSVQLLRPKNLQLFAMVTLKSIVEAYKLMLKYFWWLIILTLGCGVARVWNPATFSGVYPWLYELLLFVTCLATRPSIAKKDCAYFRSHMFVFLYVVIFLVVAPIQVWPTSFTAAFIFWILFFADSAGGPKNFLLSLWYALKMIIFNFPLITVVRFFFALLQYLLPLISKRTIVAFAFDENMMVQLLLSMHMLGNVVAIFVMPIGVCTYANIYIKKLHDQFDLYVKPI